MKLSEIHPNRREETTHKIKRMVRRAKKRNSEFGQQRTFNTRGAEDSFTHYSLSAFTDANW